jgi:hypothetical protein
MLTDRLDDQLVKRSQLQVLKIQKKVPKDGLLIIQISFKCSPLFSKNFLSERKGYNKSNFAKSLEVIVEYLQN